MMHKFLFIYPSSSFQTILNNLVAKCSQNLKEILHIKKIWKYTKNQCINDNSLE